MSTELTEEDVFSNDIDPIDAIRELRKEEGQEVDDDLQSSVEQDTSKDAQSASSNDDDGSDELEEFKETADDKSDDTDDKDDGKPESDEPKGEPKDDGDKSEDDDNDEEDLQAEDKETEAEVKSRTFKANGQEFSFTEQEIIEQFETVFGGYELHPENAEDRSIPEDDLCSGRARPYPGSAEHRDRCAERRQRRPGTDRESPSD